MSILSQHAWFDALSEYDRRTQNGEHISYKEFCDMLGESEKNLLFWAIGKKEERNEKNS